RVVGQRDGPKLPGAVRLRSVPSNLLGRLLRDAVGHVERVPDLRDRRRPRGRSGGFVEPRNGPGPDVSGDAAADLVLAPDDRVRRQGPAVLAVAEPQRRPRVLHLPDEVVGVLRPALAVDPGAPRRPT